MQGPTELSSHFLPRSSGTAAPACVSRQCPNPHADAAGILAEYEKMVGTSEAVSNARTAAERLRVLEQLKTDGLINEEEYRIKRKEIMGAL
jgi:hypothetical protein